LNRRQGEGANRRIDRFDWFHWFDWLQEWQCLKLLNSKCLKLWSRFALSNFEKQKFDHLTVPFSTIFEGFS